jgi:hypothetical protein
MDQSKFKLEKFKLIQGGGAETNWEEEEVDGEETFYEKFKKTSTKVHHPDLMNVLNQMKPMFAKAYDYSFIRDIIINDEFHASKKQAEIAESTYQEILKKINITGISVSGIGQKRGCIITATYTSPTGKKRGIVTEIINFNLQKYGFEDEFERLINDLEEEVYEFVFNNKRAKLVQGDLFQGQDGKAAAAGEEVEKD